MIIPPFPVRKKKKGSPKDMVIIQTTITLSHKPHSHYYGQN